MPAIPTVSARIPRLQNSGNNDHPARACRDDQWKILPLDPTNAENGKRNEVLDCADLTQTNGCIVGFGRGSEERAETDVVGPFLPGGDGLRRTVRGFSDDGMLADKLPRLSHTHVVLTHMGSVGSAFEDQLRMIIENERNLMVAAKLGQITSQREYLPDLPALGAQLEELDSAGNHFVGDTHCAFHLKVAKIEDAVEPRLHKRRMTWLGHSAVGAEVPQALELLPTSRAASDIALPSAGL